MYTLAQLATLTGAKPDTIYRYVRNHRIPYKRDKRGRIVTSIRAIAGYTPRNNPNWLKVEVA